MFLRLKTSPSIPSLFSFRENRFSIPTLYSIDDRGSSNQGMNNFKTKVKLWYNGTNVWSAPCIYLSSCAIDVQYFPFDDQNCDLVFASWSHSIDELNLKMERSALTILRESDGSAAFNDNEEWYLLDQSMSRREVRYTTNNNNKYLMITPLKGLFSIILKSPSPLSPS